MPSTPAFCAISWATLLLALLAHAAAVQVSYQGVNYDVFVVNGTANGLVNNATATAWWANSTAAQEFCNLVGTQAGVDNETGYGPQFVFEFGVGDFSAYGWDTYLTPPECSYQVWGRTQEFPFALSRDVPTGSLNCSQATFNPPILSSVLNGQLCAANKAVRQGRPSKSVSNVTLSLLDANNQPASINITDIVTNKATAGWQCRCRPSKRDNCTCVASAVLLGGGSFLALAQWRRSTLPGQVVDTTLQVSFTATAAGGDSCSGTATICSAWGVRPNRPPPACTAFNSTGVTRPALTCGRQLRPSPPRKMSTRGRRPSTALHLISS